MKTRLMPWIWLFRPLGKSHAEEPSKSPINFRCRFSSFPCIATLKLDAIGKPRDEWKDPIEAFQTVVDHEKGITERINNLSGLALEEKDFATHAFLQWFLTEQVEEESTTTGILERIRMLETSGSGIYLLDKDLGHRN